MPKKTDLNNIFTYLTIIIILLLIILFADKKYIFKSRNKGTIIHINKILIPALEKYYSASGLYPVTEQGLRALIEKPFLEPLPKKWEKSDLKLSDLIDPWGNPYIYNYSFSNNQHHYSILSYGADGRNGGKNQNKDILIIN